MKKAFVHIGAQKTASTFIQLNLKRHKQRLLDEHGLGLVTRSDMLQSDFCEEIYKVSQGEHPHTEVTPAAKESIHALMPDEYDDVLITNEGLICRLEIRDFYQLAGSAVQYLQNVLADFDVHVIFYIRKQTDYLESVYTQLVHLGRRIKFPRFMLRAAKVDFSWLRAADAINEVLQPGRLHLRTYEQIRNVGEVEYFRDFISLCGADNAHTYDIDEGFSKGRSANRSYGELGLKIARRVNPLLNPQERKLLRKFLQNNFSTATHPRAVLLSDEQREAVFRKYRESNRELFERYDLAADGAALGYF